MKCLFKGCRGHNKDGECGAGVEKGCKDFIPADDVFDSSQSAGWDGLSKSKMEFCYCDAIPRKVKKSVIKALEERNTEDARKMANLLKSIEAEGQPND